MADKNTIGSYIMKALTVLILFNLIYTALGYVANTYDAELDYIFESLGTGWLFSPVIDFLQTLWNWIILLLTDTIALAVIFFIALVEEAYSTKWKK